uniref:Uncharacterized protein n=1 Tax=Tanacetum cinerariifolium TaxID=118510 RepID=A0A6L2P583_TANCI|nr:hypothetical protein [Tanacetum cinerariifolium]
MVNDVLRLQALVDKKKVIITKATIRDALRLDDAEGAASVNDDEVYAAIDEPSIPSPTSSTQRPPTTQDIPSTSQVQPTPPPSLIALPQSPQHQSQPSQDARISMDLLQNLLDTCTTLTRRVKHLEQDKIAQALEITKLKQRVKKLERRNKASKLRRLKKVGTTKRIETSDDKVMDDVSKQGRVIANMDVDVDVTLKDIAKDVDVDVETEKSADVLSMQDDEVEPGELQEVVEVVTTVKLITEVVTAASTTIIAAAPQLTIAAAPTLTTAPSAAKRRKRVVIRDAEETAIPSTIIHTKAKSKDKGRDSELNKNIDWGEVIDHVQRKEKEDNDVKRYQALKRKPQTKAQARKNMMIYLRNVAGFKMGYFKGMTYDDIRLIFEKKFNSNHKLEEEVAELKRHLQIVPNDDDDDVYTEATPLACKVSVVDYKIYTENNNPHYKIIRADGSPQIFLSFLSLLRNFDREDLEVLWELVKERFASSKPKNFSDDFLLTTLTYMFEKPDVQAQVWKNQRTIHGLANVKSWRLLESHGVHIYTFTST